MWRVKLFFTFLKIKRQKSLKCLYKACRFVILFSQKMPTLFIDIGSNTIKSLLADFKQGELLPVCEATVPNRISSVDGLKAEASRIIEDSIAELSQKAKEFSEDFSIVAFGTSALRDSKNAPQVLTELKKRGINVRVLSGQEEAVFSFEGAMCDKSLNLPPSQNLIYGDLGGGSMEFVVKDDGKFICIDSLKIGAVRLTNAFFKNGYNEESVREATDFCREQLLKIAKPNVPYSLVCAGGALSAARIILGGGKMSENRILEVGHFMMGLNECLELGSDGVCKKYGVVKNRADILPAAFICLIAVMKHFGVSKIHHTQMSLRYGIAKNYFENPKFYEV